MGAPQALLGQFHYAVKVAEMPGTPDYPGTFDAALQQFGVFGTYVATVDGTKYKLDDKPIATLFDTGGGSTHFVGAPGAPPVDHLKTGDTLTATFENALTGPDGQPGPKLEWTLAAGQQQSVDYVYFVDDKTAEPRPNVNTGLDLFNAFDVLFDYQDRLVYLRPNGGQSTVILHSSVHTSGAQSYQQGNVTLSGTYTTQGGAVSVAGTTTLVGDTQITTGSGAVTFSGTIDGAHDAAAAPALTVDTIGATTFVRAVGWVDPLASLTTTGGGPTATSAVKTHGSQTYSGNASLNGPYWMYDKDSAFTVAGATTLAGPVSVNACGAAGAPERKCADTGASITFNGAVDSLANKGFPLTVVAGATGHVIFNGAVGATNPLGGLAITNADTVTARGAVSLDGGLGYSAAEGLQIGRAGEGGYVRVANFTAGGLVLGFQKDGGSNFAATNGSKGVGCDHGKDSAGACGSGVVVEGGSRLAIQGFAIANNASHGVLLYDGTGVTIMGNTIFNNSVDGVFVTGASTNNDISSNAIYGNSRNGVYVSGSGTIGNAILSNSIYSNKDWGIHLIDGGNDGQQPPESVTAQRQEKSITVSGSLAGDRKGLFQVQVFGNTVKDQQGAQLLGSGNFAVGAFTITVPEGTWATGTTTHVTVTATPVDGPQNTSEFSTAAQVE
jgi:parallel beta-helix repeat protein